MKTIVATRGEEFIVDAEDYSRLKLYPWHVNSGGYAVYSSKKNGVVYKIPMHKMIMNPQPGYIVDHINGLVNDNRKINLRVCLIKQNGKNRRKNKNNSSGHKGVSWHKRMNKWTAQIRVNYKLIYLGAFDDIGLAKSAYSAAAKYHFGEFARID